MRLWRFRYLLLNPYTWLPWTWRRPFECPVCNVVSPSLWQAAVHVEIEDMWKRLPH